jgi:hypothetical protein
MYGNKLRVVNRNTLALVDAVSFQAREEANLPMPKMLYIIPNGGNPSGKCPLPPPPTFSSVIWLNLKKSFQFASMKWLNPMNSRL